MDNDKGDLDICLDRQSFTETRDGVLRMLEGWMDGEGGAGPFDLIPRGSVTAMEEILGVASAFREALRKAVDRGRPGPATELEAALRRMEHEFGDRMPG